MKLDDPTDILSDIEDACADIVAFTHGMEYDEFVSDRQRSFSTAFRFAVLGEAVKRLSAEFRLRHPEVEWSQIAGMRDRLIHGYDTIDWQLVWKTSNVDVPVLLEQIRRMISESPQH